MIGLAESLDDEVFAAAVAAGRAVLTENVADYVPLAAEHILSGRHHAGLLLALSTRLSRRAPGMPQLASAVQGVMDDDLVDRTVYLRASDDASGPGR